MRLDDAYDAAKAIIDAAKANSAAIHTEEDTKLQIITRLLTGPLGWAHADIGAEIRHDNGFSGYLLSCEGTPAIILEAKRQGSLTLPTAQASRLRHLKLSGPVLKDAIRGIKQAAGYAQPNGIALAVLTDGQAWIVFKPVVLGAHYLEKQAFVFPSFEALLADFCTFFELLSRHNFSLGTYRILFDELPRISHQLEDGEFVA
jgi:predicted type IV restriction endonuclease